MVAALLAPLGLWVARVDDYIELGPWTWTAGIMLGWLFGLIIGRLWELVDALEQSRAQLAESAARQERTRIARELHDLVGHNFSVVLLHLAGARSILRRSPDEAEEALRKAEEVGREGMDDLREALTLMRAGTPVGQPVETVDALSELADRYRSAGLDVAVDVEGPTRATSRRPRRWSSRTSPVRASPTPPSTHRPRRSRCTSPCVPMWCTSTSTTPVDAAGHARSAAATASRA